MSELIRPATGFFTIKNFDKYLCDKQHPWWTMNATLWGNNLPEIRKSPSWGCVPVFFERDKYSCVEYTASVYNQGNPKKVKVKYDTDGQKVKLSFEGEKEAFVREQILVDEGVQLLETLETYLIRHGNTQKEETSSQIHCVTDVVRKTRYSGEIKGIDVELLYNIKESTSVTPHSTSTMRDRLDILTLQEKGKQITLERKSGGFVCSSGGQSTGGGCLWRPWPCDLAFVSSMEPFMERLYPTIYKK